LILKNIVLIVTYYIMMIYTKSEITLLIFAEIHPPDNNNFKQPQAHGMPVA